ncbi:MAG TPA: hypothetical protein VHB51_01325 [Candidatus Saccharimonadales bacterium]|nr:hypothetical protein [Candidatus Saccharimonadales bacterium]
MTDREFERSLRVSQRASDDDESLLKLPFYLVGLAGIVVGGVIKDIFHRDQKVAPQIPRQALPPVEVINLGAESVVVD